MAFAKPAVNNTDVEVADAPSDTISSVSFSPSSAQSLVCATSWDNSVRVWDISPQGQARGVAAYNHEAPVLSAAWSADGSKIVSSGCDNAGACSFCKSK